MNTLKNQKFYFVVTEYNDETLDYEICDSLQEANERAKFEAILFNRSSEEKIRFYVAYTMPTRDYYNIPRFNPFFRLGDLQIDNPKTFSEEILAFDTNYYVVYNRANCYDFIISDARKSIAPLGEHFFQTIVENAPEYGSYREAKDEIRAYLAEEIEKNFSCITKENLKTVVAWILDDIKDLISNEFRN